MSKPSGLIPVLHMRVHRGAALCISRPVSYKNNVIHKSMRNFPTTPDSNIYPAGRRTLFSVVSDNLSQSL